MKYLLFTFFLSLSVFSFGQGSNEPRDIRVAAPPVSPEPSVYRIVESMPEFPGGIESMYKFIQKNLMYPDSARNHDISGRVVVTFVVNEDGSLTDIKVKRSVSWDIDKEALRVVKLLPKFIPGKQQGKAVKVLFDLPISFKLS